MTLPLCINWCSHLVIVSIPADYALMASHGPFAIGVTLALEWLKHGRGDRDVQGHQGCPNGSNQRWHPLSELALSGAHTHTHTYTPTHTHTGATNPPSKFHPPPEIRSLLGCLPAWGPLLGCLLHGGANLARIGVTGISCDWMRVCMGQGLSPGFADGGGDGGVQVGVCVEFSEAQQWIAINTQSHSTRFLPL